MKIIPVIDIKNNLVVHAKSGKRNKYEPIKSDLCETSNPKNIIDSFREKLNLDTVYIADLDSIEKKGDNFDIIEKIKNTEIYLDSGIKTYKDFQKIKSLCSRKIVATETLENLNELKKITEIDKNIILSIDMYKGKVLSKITTSIDAILNFATDYGIKTLILLDLYYVGRGQMRSSSELKKIIKKDHFEVITGGGIKSREDLIKLKNTGVWGVLVATALHKNQITKKDIDDISKDL